jgi:hypothetical protein
VADVEVVVPSVPVVGDVSVQGVQVAIAGGVGSQGPQGPTGATGVVDADAPLTYDVSTFTVGIDPAGYVASVNGQTGAATITASGLGAYLDTNPSGFVDAAGAAAAAPVQFVNGAQGTVVLTTSDVAEGTALYYTDLRAAAAAPVQSVNSQAGTVLLDAASVGAYPDTNPSLFVDAAGAAAAAPVQSVNALTGTVLLDAASVGAYPDDNPSAFVDASGAAAAAPVQSVNGAAGTVVLTATDVGAYPDTNPSGFIDSAGAPVQSVNTYTGTVVLGASDVGAYPDTNPSAFVDAAGAAVAAPVQSVNSLTGTVLIPTVEVSGTAPSNLLSFWIDLSEAGAAVVPAGGAAGQSLVKVSGDDYDTTWADLDTDGVSEGTVNLYNRVPTGGTALQVLTKNSGTDFDASFEYPQFSWDYKSGEYYGPQTAASASGTRVNRIDALPVFFPRPITVDRISFRISAGGAAGSLVRLGIYSSGPDGLPSDLLHDFGTVDGTVPANPTEITISETLQGFLWLAARYNDNSPTIIVSSAVAAPWAPRNSGMTVHGAGILTAVLPSGDTLVDPFPISSAATGTSVTVMRVRAA